MAIVFFSFNGAGSGGGGSGVTTLDNGLTLSTPTNGQLGGVLIQDTTIDVNTHNFFFTAINGTNETDYAQSAAQILLFGDNGTNSVNFSIETGANTGSSWHLNKGANQAGIRLIDNVPGVIVTDTNDGIGLVGDVLFAVSSNPNQYVQEGNLPAPPATILANNGLAKSVNTIQLGGALVKNTAITAGTFSLSMNSISGANNASWQLFLGILTQSITNGARSAKIVFQNSGTPEVLISYADTGIGVLKQLDFSNNNTGILLTDTGNNTGLNGNVLFPISGAPEQYAQYGNIAQGLVKTNVAGHGLSSSTTIITYPVTVPVIRISSTLFILTSSGLGINVNVAWTDPAGGSNTAILVSGVILGNFPGDTITIKALVGSNVVISTLVSGANVYDVDGLIENLF